MATHLRDNFDFEEQRVRILRSIEEAEKFLAERKKLDAEEAKLRKDVSLSPWMLLAQGLIAGAALMGASLALAKYFIG